MLTIYKIGNNMLLTVKAYNIYMFGWLYRFELKVDHKKVGGLYNVLIKLRC